MKINEKNLCVFATHPPYDCEGFLSKRGEVNKAFQRRYFVLKGNLLFYFEKKGDKEPLGLIIVEGCTIELSEESDQYCFEIAFNGNRTYILSAESQESMERWMKALTCAGYEYKKLMVAELQRQLEEIESSRNKMFSAASKPPAAPPTVPDRPTRTNPFNRPAPPLPCHVPDKSQTTKMPFINDRHFAEAPTTAALQNNNNNNNQLIAGPTPIPPARGIRLGTSAAARNNSQFHTSLSSNCEPVPPGGAVVVAQNADVCEERLKRLTAQFEEHHDRYRKQVMKDILHYRREREVKLAPLIDLS